MRSAAMGGWTCDAGNLSLNLVECGHGDRRSLEILYGALAGGIRWRLIQLLHDTALAEDVLQETFVAVWRYAYRFDPKLSIPATWIWTIARNRALSVLQRRRRECDLAEVAGFEERPDLGPTPYELTLREEEAAVLSKCLEKLTPAARECVNLAYFQGLSYAQVSSRLGRPIGSVKTTFRGALKVLRICMAHELSARPPAGE